MHPGQQIWKQVPYKYSAVQNSGTFVKDVHEGQFRKIRELPEDTVVCSRGKLSGVHTKQNIVYALHRLNLYEMAQL